LRGSSRRMTTGPVMVLRDMSGPLLSRRRLGFVPSPKRLDVGDELPRLISR
jgi:hypothetical protein